MKKRRKTQPTNEKPPKSESDRKKRFTNENFDYVDLRVALDGKHALPSFQGLSGGGLWQAEIQRNDDGSVALAGPYRLVGCAFYETEAKGKYRYIRCHGWRTIYEQGLTKLRLRE